MYPIPISCLNKPSDHCDFKIFGLTLSVGRPFILVINALATSVTLRLSATLLTRPSWARYWWNIDVNWEVVMGLPPVEVSNFL